MNAKVKFVAVGLANTAFSTIVFFVIDKMINSDGRSPVAADVALVLSLLLATPFAYFMQRRFVFVTGQPATWPEFGRFATVASGMYALNLIALPILVFLLNHLHHGSFHLVGMDLPNSFIGQMVVTLIVACLSWTSHSRFSFKAR